MTQREESLFLVLIGLFLGHITGELVPEQYFETLGIVGIFVGAFILGMQFQAHTMSRRAAK